MSTNLDREIDLFMANFDYARVHGVMEFLQWNWAHADCGYGVPDIDYMKQVNRYYLKRAAIEAQAKLVETKKKKARSRWGTGGFEYEAVVYRNDPKVYLSMAFNVADWNNWD